MAKVHCSFKILLSPGQCGSVGGASSCKPNGCRFDPQLGHMHGLRFGPQSGHVQDEIEQCFSHISVSLPPFFPPFSLSRINKRNLKIKYCSNKFANIFCGISISLITVLEFSLIAIFVKMTYQFWAIFMSHWETSCFSVLCNNMNS